MLKQEMTPEALAEALKALEAAQSVLATAKGALNEAYIRSVNLDDLPSDCRRMHRRLAQLSI